MAQMVLAKKGLPANEGTPDVFMRYRMQSSRLESGKSRQPHNKEKLN